MQTTNLYCRTVKKVCRMYSIALFLSLLAAIYNTNTSTAQSIQIIDFETWCPWKQGDEPWGKFNQSQEQVYSGSFAGKLEYNFPADEPKNYVVFKCPISIPGQPTALSLWVYGDGSTHFLNAWIQDAAGRPWQFTFGRINHIGWQQMIASMDPNLPWPNDPLDNSNATIITYPISFQALVLDDPSNVASQGAIYVDDLSGLDNYQLTATATPIPTTPPQQSPEISFSADDYTIDEGQCTTLRWNVEYVLAVYLDDEGKAGHGEKDVCPKQDRTYKLRIVTHTGEEFRTVIIEVRNPSVNYYADAETLVYGQCTYLHWDTQNVQAVYLNDNPTDSNGSLRICPEHSLKYTLRVVTSLGEKAHSIMIKVVNPLLCINSFGGEYLIYEVSSQETLRFPYPMYRGGDGGTNYFMIINCGSDPLILQQIRVDDKDNEFIVEGILKNFVSQTDVNGILPPGGKCYMQVLFAPVNNYTEHKAWLYIYSTSSDRGFKAILLTGKSKSLPKVKKDISRSDEVGSVQAPLDSSVPRPAVDSCLALPQH